MRRLPMSFVLSAALLMGAAPQLLAQPGAVPPPDTITLKAADGIALKATYFSAGKPGPGIVMLHACNRDRTSWAPLATAAASRGFHVIALDFRGYGESEGQRLEVGQEQQAIITQKWPGDVDAAFTWLKSQPGVDGERIAAAGASCGVNQSVQLARRHPEVKTVVLLSGGVNPQGREYLRQTDWLPILASASHDDGDAVATARWVLGWSRNSANTFLEYKAAGHGTDMFAVEKDLVPAIADWFDAHLRGAAARPVATAGRAAPTPVVEFWTALEQPGGIARAKLMYEETRRRDPKLVLFPEGEMNLYGYQLLENGKASDAVAVFQLNVEAYPGSANVYDSLSDGHLAAGNRADALRFAEKSLEMLAADTRVPEGLRNAIKESAEKKIRELRSQKLQ